MAQAFLMLAAVAVAALVRELVKLAREHVLNLVQARLGEGAARVAGQILADIAARPDVQVASQDMIAAGVAVMRHNFPDSARRLSDEQLAGMLRGELGKLGQAVLR
ncbi:hypothetical protein KTR66_24060 [Roseococcus sp. SDR]|uniref:hypothetical protein n=1 Tax=Roseococcus sp. SDR TaxID=2835532 RepID=UPI001BCB711A|nr:hypothetical protein [Roseococcus sp. SDR]MBS7793078.1 hypothetical protein [Roseococcus sp. SDR]MBV1848392.1 hypothetical protein [Roseococcus sp. SDR]